MKIFENAYANVLCAIPTPRFFLELLPTAFEKSKYRVQGQLLKMSKSLSNWTEYVDVYNKRYISMYIQYDSFFELAKLINDEIRIDRDYYGNLRKQIISQHEKDENQKWDQFFENVFKN